MRMRVSPTALTLAFAVCFAIPAWADHFSFSTSYPAPTLGTIFKCASLMNASTR